MGRSKVEITNNNELKARLKAVLENVLHLACGSRLVAALQVSPHDKDRLNAIGRRPKINKSSHIAAMGLTSAQSDRSHRDITNKSHASFATHRGAECRVFAPSPP